MSPEFTNGPQEENIKQQLKSLQTELSGVLSAELDQYRDLLGLLEAQRKHFTSGNIKAFEENSRQQGTVVLKIKTFEEARKSIVRSISELLKISPEDFTLTQLAALVDEPYSSQCILYQREILAIIADLESIRESNAYLVQHALHYVSGVLKTFASNCVAEHTYSKNARIERDTEKGKFVSGWT